MTDDPERSARFEEALAELEDIVRRLESGELTLEDSLATFERGIALVRTLSGRLADIEQRVEVLMRSASGKLVVEPLADEEE